MNPIRNIALAAVLGTLVGCTEADTKTPTKAEATGDASAYLVSEEPANALGVIEAREKAEDGKEVVVAGRVGGEIDPWVEGRAAFMIADTSIKPCNEIEGDTCKTPWDYCCEPDLAKKRLLVKVVGDDGKPLDGGAQELFGLKELQKVVVKGTAKRDEEGNLIVLADKLYVAK